MAESLTNGLTMKLMALAVQLQGSHAADVKDFIAQLPGAVEKERSEAKATIIKLTDEIDALKQRLTNKAPITCATPPTGPRTEKQDLAGLSSSPLPRESHGKTLYVGSIPYDVSDPEIKDFFQPYGAQYVRRPINPLTKAPKEFAFVTLEKASEAERAIQELRGKAVDGRPIIVQLVKNASTPEIAQKPPTTKTNVDFPRDPPRLPRVLTTESDPTHPPAKRQRLQSPPPRSKPKCMECFQRQTTCDGKPACGTCVKKRHRCKYSGCWHGLDCRDVGCDRLHPDQWDPVLEPHRNFKPWS